MACCLVCYGAGGACSLNFGVLRFEYFLCPNPLLVVSAAGAPNVGWLSYCFRVLASLKALKLQLVLGALNRNSAGFCPRLVFGSERALAQLVA
ncbi:hypothetical protein AAHH86_00100 [Candidatus Hodgkinia cicadicola]